MTDTTHQTNHHPHAICGDPTCGTCYASTYPTNGQIRQSTPRSRMFPNGYRDEPPHTADTCDTCRQSADRLTAIRAIATTEGTAPMTRPERLRRMFPANMPVPYAVIEAVEDPVKSPNDPANAGEFPPLTDEELDAIRQYNEFIDPVMADLDHLYGRRGDNPYNDFANGERTGWNDAIRAIHTDMSSLNTWKRALNDLYVALDSNDGSHQWITVSNTAERLMRWEANRLIDLSDRVRSWMAQFFFDFDIPVDNHGHLDLDDGVVTLRHCNNPYPAPF